MIGREKTRQAVEAWVYLFYTGSRGTSRFVRFRDSTAVQSVTIRVTELSYRNGFLLDRPKIRAMHTSCRDRSIERETTYMTLCRHRIPKSPRQQALDDPFQSIFNIVRDHEFPRLHKLLINSFDVLEYARRAVCTSISGVP